MTQSLFPVVVYRDAAAAIDFLERAFGFERAAVHTDDAGTVVHAEVAFRGGLVMLGTAREGGVSAPGQGVVYVVVEDADAHHDRAVAAGAQVEMALTDQDYGSRDYSARHPEGNLWSFGTYAPTAPPARV